MFPINQSISSSIIKIRCYIASPMALNFPFPSSGGFLADGGAAALPPQLFLDKSFDCDPSGYCAVTCSSLFHDPSPSSSPSRPVSPFYDNIADLLPADPFGMGVSATIAGLIEDLATTAGYLEFGDVWSHQAAIGECSTSTCTSSETLPVSAAKGAPHEGLLFALPYLKIPDLLSMERVCKTLNSAIREDTLLWRCIHIGQPLNFTINDDVFLGLTRRARGNLECLFLRECRFITDSCLGLVLMENLKLKQVRDIDLGLFHEDSGCFTVSIIAKLFSGDHHGYIICLAVIILCDCEISLPLSLYLLFFEHTGIALESPCKSLSYGLK